MLEVFNYEDMICARGSREMPWKPTFRMSVYYYLIDGLLIDSGPFTLAEEAIEFFNAHEIEQVFLSHIHEDHSGMAYWLQAEKQLPIYLHRGSLEEAEQEPELAEYRLSMWGRRRAFKAQPAAGTLKTQNYVFDVIDSPGHYPCHLLLHEKTKGWLFCGDHIYNLKPKSIMYDENMKDTISSIKNILDLDFSTVFCPHSGIRKKARRLFQIKLDYLLEMQENIQSLREKGIGDKEITQQLFPGPDPIGTLSRGEFSPYYLVSSL